MAADATLLYLSTRKLEVEPGAGVLPLWRRALNVLSWIEPNVGVAPVGITVKVPRQQVSDLQRVSYFWKRLKKNGQVGTIDEPEEWIEGSHRVRYQTFSWINPPNIWFSGETERTQFHLGGAQESLLIARAPAKPTDAPVRLFEGDVARAVARALGRGPEKDNPGDDPEWVAHVEEIWRFSQDAGNEAMELECQFLAVKEEFDTGTSYGGKAHLLGSPLLVTYRRSA
jgi:hypothetical protein